jgi:hypothetical protein
MANADTPHGLRPVQYVGGTPYIGKVGRYYIPATDSTGPNYIGQLVKPAGTADINGVMAVTGNVSTGNAVLGPIVAVEHETADSPVYRPDDVARYVYVADDPDLLFAVQDDAASTPTASTVGNSADLAGFTSGSTASGLSATEISMASVTASGDGTEDVIIMGLLRTPDNEIGDHAEWLVRLNNHYFTDASAGA